MKKLLTIILTLSLIALAFTGCGGNDSEDNEDSETVVKTGLGVVTTVGSSTEAEGSNNGTAQTDSVVAAVTLDNEGKIIKCKIDGTQTKIEFGNDGKIVTSMDTVFDSKNVLATDYGLGTASSIGKEWNEQAQAFAEYCQGKTIDEITGIEIDENNVPTGSDLTSSVTIQVGDFIAAIEKAVNTAKDLGAGSADSLGLGVETNMANSSNATSEENGVAEATTNYVVVTFGNDAKITSAYIDSAQADVEFDTNGKITGDLNKEIKTKQELGNDYGMKGNSSIDKEWFEQADSFAAFVIGKTVDEVKGIQVNSDGAPEDADLTSSVTISVTDYINLIEKAAENEV